MVGLEGIALDAWLLKERQDFKLTQEHDINHIVEGIIIGLDNIDDVIDLIRKVTSNSIASTDLKKRIQLSEKKVEAILDINLKRLTMLEVQLCKIGKTMREIMQSSSSYQFYVTLLTSI